MEIYNLMELYIFKTVFEALSFIHSFIHSFIQLLILNYKRTILPRQ